MSLELNGTAVPNFGLLGHSQIDNSNDIASVGGNMVCRTDNTLCCRNENNPDSTVGFGNWFYPAGAVAVFPYYYLVLQHSLHGSIYLMQRGTQVVRLRRELDSNTTTANGIYRCEVADQNGVNQTRYVGLYTEGAGKLIIVEYLKSCYKTHGNNPSFYLIRYICMSKVQ